MTRIVGGIAGGRVLKVPAGGTRPTSDRVREALFSTLDGLLELSGARVLDLFAGTGAVGLEAASRGAAQVTLVDSGREAAATLRANSAVVDGADVAIRAQPVETFLAGAATEFDLVFADPPYAYPEHLLASVLDALVPVAAITSWLAPGAVVVVERAARAGAPTWPVVIDAIKSKRYGDSVLWYGRHA